MKKVIKKVFIGFSLIEVVIAVNLLALILAILGLSALGSQKLLLNAQIKSQISKVGEGILDYVCSLPPNDSYFDPTQNQSNQNNIVSLADFANNIITDPNILNNVNSILSNGVNSFKVGIASSLNVNTNFTHKGRVIQFGNNANTNSYIQVTNILQGNNNNNLVFQVRVVILYQSNPNNLNRISRIEVSRVVAF